MSDEYEFLQQRIREKAHQLWLDAGAPVGDDQRFWYLARIEIDQEEAKLDKEVAGSFPASDPPSSSVTTGAMGESAPAAGADQIQVPDPAAATQASPPPARRRAK